MILKTNTIDINESKPAVLVLAGGLSERMEFPKPWLPFNKNQSFLEKLVKEYFRFGCRQLIVVINEAFCNPKWDLQLSEIAKYATIIKNDQPEKGRSFSIYTGLKSIADCPYLFVQNIDNPFIDLELLTALYQYRNEEGYVVPTFEKKGGHPILISKKIFDQLKLMGSEAINLKELIKTYHRTELEYPNAEILANINTKADYKTYFNANISL